MSHKDSEHLHLNAGHGASPKVDEMNLEHYFCVNYAWSQGKYTIFTVSHWSVLHSLVLQLLFYIFISLHFYKYKIFILIHRRKRFFDNIQTLLVNYEFQNLQYFLLGFLYLLHITLNNVPTSFTQHLNKSVF